MNYVAVFIGGGLGALLRFLMAAGVNKISPGFPAGTLTVNVIGSFFIGFCFYALSRQLETYPLLLIFLITGVFGGFTTFSAFSWETLRLFETGFIFNALLNVGLNIFVCLAAVYAGSLAGRYI